MKILKTLLTTDKTTPLWPGTNGKRSGVPPLHPDEVTGKKIASYLSSEILCQVGSIKSALYLLGSLEKQNQYKMYV